MNQAESTQQSQPGHTLEYGPLIQLIMVHIVPERYNKCMYALNESVIETNSYLS